MSDVLVQVEGISKKFCRSLKRSLWYGLQDLAAEAIGSGAGHDRLRREEFWAVDDVSFELRRGECLGLLGRNGAGKTTLLKILNGLIKPDRGRARIRGRVGALIALGAGFNPILTGRENILVNASVLGIGRAEIESQMDAIIDFAEIRDFIDSPVRSYSSGMQVRLGFAVATALEPDVLILDEVLAVGDAAFRAKCYNRLTRLLRGAAVIFVSHSMEQVGRICTSGLVLKAGRTAFLGEVGPAIRTYGELNAVADRPAEAFLSLDDRLASGEVRVGSGRVLSGGTLEVEVRCAPREAFTQTRLRVLFYAADGQVVAEFDSRGPHPATPVEQDGVPGWRVVGRLGPIHLRAGTYRLGVNLLGVKDPAVLLWSHKELAVEIDGPEAGLAAYQLPAA